MDAANAKYHTNAIYCFMFVGERDGQRIYVPCHRKYKPINVYTRDYVKYADYINSHGVFFDCDPSKLDVWATDSRETCYYLYGDNPASRLDYVPRMKIILKHLRPYRESIAVAH